MIFKVVFTASYALWEVSLRKPTVVAAKLEPWRLVAYID